MYIDTEHIGVTSLVHEGQMVKLKPSRRLQDGRDKGSSKKIKNVYGEGPFTIHSLQNGKERTVLLSMNGTPSPFNAHLFILHEE